MVKAKAIDRHRFVKKPDKMKIQVVLLLCLFYLPKMVSQNVGINADGSSPDLDAQTHIKSQSLKYGLLNEMTGSGPAIRYGTFNNASGDASAAFYGTYNQLINSGTSALYGNYNVLNSDKSAAMYATFNIVFGEGIARKYGTYNSLNASSGLQYGTYSTIDSDNNDFEQFGSSLIVKGSGNGDHFGTHHNLNGNGTGRKIGLSNSMSGSGSGVITGVSTSITNIGSSNHYGVENLIENGAGDHYGVHNTITGNVSTSGNHFGIYSLISSEGSGLHYGSYSELTGVGSGLQVGNGNEVSNSSDSEHWGTYNELSGTGSGSHKGSYNLMLGSGSGIQYGSHQQISISGNGAHLGCVNDLSSVGDGDHYGSKNSLSGNGEGDQYGTHNEITNSGSGTKYGTFNAVTSGTGLHYAGWFDAAGSTNNYAAVFNRGDVVANEVGGTFDFRVESNNENGMFFVDGTNDRVGVGTDAPAVTLHINDDDSSGRIVLIENVNTSNNADALAIKIGPNANPTTSNAYIAFRDGDNSVIGSITGNGGGGTNYNTTSDRRLKKNIQDFDGGLELVNKIQSRIYERVSNPGHEEIGFIAQELYEILPQIVSGNPDQSINAPMSVDYGKLTPVLVAAIQELSLQNELLKTEIERQSSLLQSILHAQEQGATYSATLKK